MTWNENNLLTVLVSSLRLILQATAHQEVRSSHTLGQAFRHVSPNKINSLVPKKDQCTALKISNRHFSSTLDSLSTSLNHQKYMQPVSIVLLGGIASGKSRVASLFEELGAKILDADSIAHELLGTEEVRSLIMTTFGDDFIAGNQVDRKKLAADVFSDKDKLKTLEGILHPRVFARLTEETQKLSTMKTRQVVLFDVPLAAETGMLDSVDLVVFVDTDEAIRIKRAVETRGWTAEELLQRERNQWPLDKKREAATHTVRNSQTVAEAREDVRRIWNQSIKPKLEEN